METLENIKSTESNWMAPKAHRDYNAVAVRQIFVVNSTTMDKEWRSCMPFTKSITETLLQNLINILFVNKLIAMQHSLYTVGMLSTKKRRHDFFFEQSALVQTMNLFKKNAEQHHKGNG